MKGLESMTEHDPNEPLTEALLKSFFASREQASQKHDVPPPFFARLILLLAVVQRF